MYDEGARGSSSTARISNSTIGQRGFPGGRPATQPLSANRGRPGLLARWPCGLARFSGRRTPHDRIFPTVFLLVRGVSEPECPEFSCNREAPTTLGGGEREERPAINATPPDSQTACHRYYYGVTNGRSSTLSRPNYQLARRQPAANRQSWKAAPPITNP